MAEILVAAAGLLLIAALTWFFFGPRGARKAERRGDVQEATITVKGGYSPDRVRVKEGVPLRIVFDRQEGGECTSRVLFPDFAVNAALPAFARTAVELLPDRAGEFGFACGMNMVHGTLIVERNGNGGTDAGSVGEDGATGDEPKAIAGLAQIAMHLGRTVVPIGCSGSDRVYPGSSPIARAKRSAVTPEGPRYSTSVAMAMSLVSVSA